MPAVFLNILVQLEEVGSVLLHPQPHVVRIFYAQHVHLCQLDVGTLPAETETNISGEVILIRCK